MQKIKGFIFDIDGTLIDSNDVHAECLKFGLASAGYKFETSVLRPLIGMGLDQILPKIINQTLESRQGKQISEVKDECFTQQFDQIKVFPNVKNLFKCLHQNGFLLTIATSASKDDLKKLITKLEIEEFILTPISSDDIQQSKPAPDAISAALKVLGLSCDEVYMVGDTIYDVEAAVRAKVHTIALRCGGWKDPELKGAAMILDDPAALLTWLQSNLISGQTDSP